MHPWSRYIDEVHNTWETASDFAARGVTVVDSTSPNGPPLPFTGVRDQVSWAFTQVGVDSRLIGGWFTVPSGLTGGSFTETWYAGESIPAPVLPAGNRLLGMTPHRAHVGQSVLTRPDLSTGTPGARHATGQPFLGRKGRCRRWRRRRSLGLGRAVAAFARFIRADHGREGTRSRRSPASTHAHQGAPAIRPLRFGDPGVSEPSDSERVSRKWSDQCSLGIVTAALWPTHRTPRHAGTWPLLVRQGIPSTMESGQ
jgi:hypothetical protein